ncbi:3-oxoacyl-[acyl-carrier protein] reductase [Paraburkholderia sp. GAS448]|uniref:SDR family NAD(P)-dependent oxidoreductase n=1 Tax=Paraburkholderia sp. GAS448 TaxID=3035136 RepID=UPI003D194718
MSDTNFTGKNILVVGGSSGIGNGIAQGFCLRGANVAVWGTRARASDYEGVEGSNLTDLQYSCVDVSDADAIVKAAAEHGSLDVLVLAQGILVPGGAEFERKNWNKVMAVNLDSLIHCCNAFRSALRETCGSIIIVGSAAAIRTAPEQPAYSASKGAAASLVKNLASTWAAEGIRVNGIAPGFVHTKLASHVTGDAAVLGQILPAIPARRLGEPSEMAGAAVFLASPLASYVHGHMLVVDGGVTV